MSVLEALCEQANTGHFHCEDEGYFGGVVKGLMCFLLDGGVILRYFVAFVASRCV